MNCVDKIKRELKYMDEIKRKFWTLFKIKIM